MLQLENQFEKYVFVYFLQSSQVRRRTPGSDVSASRQEGNIHRLVSSQDNDDENNTWNGNSTQQM